MNLNIDPYYDDFEDNAKLANYLKILFQPEYSVQARELTQIQSILQNQIKSFGDHIFKDGSPVMGGNLTLDNNVKYLKLNSVYENADIDPESFVDQIIVKDGDSSVQAKVLAQTTLSSVPILMLRYLTDSVFADTDVIKIAGTTTKARVIDSSSGGKGTIVSINDGIFYVNGFFVKVNPHSAVVDATSTSASAKIGLEITEEIIDFNTDSTLLDPAMGSSNYQAPGADRFQITLTLSTRPLDSNIDQINFIELMRVENGLITKQIQYAIYSELEKTLARRTYDESGDYTVRPFIASLSANANNTNYYVVNIEPGKAYVRGFEFETIGTYKINVPKPRTVGVDTRDLTDIDVDTSYGNYITVKGLHGSRTGTNTFIDILNQETLDLHCVPSTDVNIGAIGGAAANSWMYGNTKIGTAKVRNIQRDSSSADAEQFDSNGIFRLYLTDVDIKPVVLRVGGASQNALSLNLSLGASHITNAYNNVSVTTLPYDLVVSTSVNGTANVVKGNNTLLATSVTDIVVGDTIRCGLDVRNVVYKTAGQIDLDRPFSFSRNNMPVYIQRSYSSNVINMTRTITSYNGTSKIAILDREFDYSSVPNQNTVFQLNFSIKDAESIMEANVFTPVVNVFANVALSSKLLNGDAYIAETSRHSLIFKLPRDYVKRGSLYNVDYYHTKYMTATTSNGVITMDSGSGFDTFETRNWSITNSNIEDNLIVVIREDANNVSNGKILKLTTANVSALGAAGLRIDTGDIGFTKFDVYVNVKENDSNSRIRIKTLRQNESYTTESGSFNYPSNSDVTMDHTVGTATKTTGINVQNGLIFVNYGATDVRPGDAINLYVPDVVKLKKVLKGNTTIFANTTVYEDITSHFNIDFGQRSDIYDHAKLILKQGYPSPNSKLTVHVDFFDHVSGSSYFSVDSYADTIYDNGNIPVFVSGDTTYFLRDCLDFRPTKTIGLDTGVLSGTTIPYPDSATELSMSYYLPRIDKLVLSKNKEFRVIQGVSAPNPIPPEDDVDSMTMYVFYLPPYVGNVKDIRTKYIENKRYTMKDIASLDKRVERVEYFTSLSTIENKAFDDQTQYEDGTNKEKFGIVGENFRNFNIADFRNPDFTVSMVKDQMTPYQVNKVQELAFIRDGADANIASNERTITLAYSETPCISQNLTSNKTVSVQPYLFATFRGEVSLNPQMDPWISETLPPVVITGPQTVNDIQEIGLGQAITDRYTIPNTVETVPAPVSNAALQFLDGYNLGIDGLGIPIVIPSQSLPVGGGIQSIINLSPIDHPGVVWGWPQIQTENDYVQPLPDLNRRVSNEGCVALESYVPLVDEYELTALNSNPDLSIQAYHLEGTSPIMLGDETTLESKVGYIEKMLIRLEECVRIETVSGVSLVCSTSAPIPTLNNGIKKAPTVSGEDIGVMKDGKTYWDRVIGVESVGVKYVRAIDTGNNSFWAGEKKDAYILHHNVNIGHETIRKF